MPKSNRIEIQLDDADELLAYLQEEAATWNIGVRNYLELIARAAFRANRKGDTRLVGLLIGGAVLPDPQPPAQPPKLVSDETNAAIDDALKNLL